MKNFFEFTINLELTILLFHVEFLPIFFNLQGLVKRYLDIMKIVS